MEGLVFCSLPSKRFPSRGRLATLKNLHTANTNAPKNKFVGIIALKANIPKNIERITIDPNRARFSIFVIFAKLAMQLGNPSPNEIPTKVKRNDTLTTLAVSNIINAKEENTPIKVHAKRKCFWLLSLFIREAPANKEATAAENSIIYKTSFSPYADDVLSIASLRITETQVYQTIILTIIIIFPNAALRGMLIFVKGKFIYMYHQDFLQCNFR